MKFYDLIVETSHIKLVYVCVRMPRVASALSPVMTGSWPGTVLLHAGISCMWRENSS